MSTEQEVLAASGRFYSALNGVLNGDAGAMAEVWSHAANVTAMHPLAGRQVGWDQVDDSFRQVAKLASGGQVKVADQRVQANGDLAYEVATEKGHVGLGGERVSIEHRVTNVYRREGGAWKIVHHHTDVSPAMVELLKRVQDKG